MPDAKTLVELLASARFRFNNEGDLQTGIERLLIRDGIEHRREFRLSPKDRIDFLVGDIGMEVKVRAAAKLVEAQLARYAKDERVKTLILVTSSAQHRMLAGEVEGKPLYVAYLVGSLF